MTVCAQAELPLRPSVDPSSATIELAIVVPTYNELPNVSELTNVIKKALAGIEWELIFVDDNSADGTAEFVRQMAASDRRIRILERIGRRGLASACVEGMQATPASFIAVMDADLQHDESILAKMLTLIKSAKADIVIGSRYLPGGGTEGLSVERRWLSMFGSHIARLLCRCEVSDPMSGFFLVDRSFFRQVVHRLSARGFKLLLDVLSSSPLPARVEEVPYQFRPRRAGKSKLNVRIELEYLILVADKSIGRLLPTRFVLFSVVGGVGLIVHLLTLVALYNWGNTSFAFAQTLGSLPAMILNFTLDNAVTFRDRRLHGWKLIAGLAVFSLVCSIGLIVNISLARFLLTLGVSWYLAGVAGLAVGAVWNYATNLALTWRGHAIR